MNSITQLDPLGCGAACVSFIAQKSYSEVVATLGRDYAKHRGFYCKDLIDILAKFGFSYAYKYVKPQLKSKIYQDGVIVFIKRSKKYPAGHYLTRYKDQWMDPWVNFCADSDIANAKSGFRRRLPGKPIYALFSTKL